MKKFINKSLACLVVCILICTINSYAVEEFKAFRSKDFNGNSASDTSVYYGVWTFQKLGYRNAGGSGNYYNNCDRNFVLNWINGYSNNYGFYEYAHGNSELFTMQDGNQWNNIYPSDISGNWHLVFLDSCSCLSTTRFARAFNIYGYGNRAIMGWYDTVLQVSSADWWQYFYRYAGNMGLREACLAAARDSAYDNPIRLFGDGDWNGIARY